MQFTDIHLDLNRPCDANIFPHPTEDQRQAMGSSVDAMATALADAIRARQEEIPDEHGFSVVVPAFAQRYRVQRMRAGYYAARRLEKAPQSLGELRLRKPYIDLLLKDEYCRTGGLILVAGLTGAGKSTTAVATILDRLTRYGGYCATFEKPLEFLMEGRHGDYGVCEQIDITGLPLDQVQEMLLRIFPAKDRVRSMLFYGEIRTNDAAADMLRTAINGHLVITTMHGMDIVSTLQRLAAMAAANGMADAPAVIGMALKLIIHLQLDKGHQRINVLETNQRVSNILGAGDFAMLNDDIATANRAISRKLAEGG